MELLDDPSTSNKSIPHPDKDNEQIIDSKNKQTENPKNKQTEDAENIIIDFNAGLKEGIHQHLFKLSRDVFKSETRIGVSMRRDIDNLESRLMNRLSQVEGKLMNRLSQVEGKFFNYAWRFFWKISSFVSPPIFTFSYCTANTFLLDFCGRYQLRLSLLCCAS